MHVHSLNVESSLIDDSVDGKNGFAWKSGAGFSLELRVNNIPNV